MERIPAVDGSAPIRTPSRAFLAAFVRRVEGGLLRGASARRNRYQVADVGPDRLVFRAVGWATAFNVGLNDVEIAISDNGRIRYRVEYRRWAGYCLALGAVVGLALIAFILLFDLRTYIATHPGPAFPGLSVDQNLAIAWAMALFWGFVWPWILIALHKRPLRRLMEQLIAEVDAVAGQNA